MPAQSPRAPILVTGATGRQGGTGRYVTEQLLARGLPVRALVRTLDERAQSLTDLGAEVVVGDFADFQSLLKALDGVESAYFCYPVADGITEAAGLFAAAGREQRLTWLVDLSLAASDPRNPSPQGRAQWVAERIFDWAGFGGVHLRIAAFFMENLLYLHGPQIREDRVIRNAFGDYPASWMAAADVGAMATALLVDPNRTVERTVVAGAAERLDHSEIADLITQETGHLVRYQEVTPDQWREELVTAAESEGRPNPRGAAHLSAQAVTLRSKPLPALTDRVQRITGRPATTFAEFIRTHRDQLCGSPAPAESAAD